MAPREIKRLRERLGETQAEFARRLGLRDRSSVCNLETGRREPTGPVLALLLLIRSSAKLQPA